MNRIRLYLTLGLIAIIITLSTIIGILKLKLNNAQEQLQNKALIVATKEANIQELQKILDNQNKKITELSNKQQESIKKYKEWLAKEDKYKKEIQDILKLQGSNTAETLINRLERIKLKGYKGL